MIASALDAIIAIDERGIVLEFNAAAERLFGYRRDEVVGWRLEDRVVPPALRDAHEAGFSRYVATGTAATLLQARVEVPALRKDGSEFHAELAVTENRIGGHSIFTAFFRDVSKRTAAEAERKSLEAQLRQSQKMEAVGRLAGGVAHDFNNLLTVIGGHAELLLQRLDADDPRRTHAVQVGRAGDKAAALTRKLLAISRRQVLDARVVSLNEVVEDVAPMIERILGEDVTLELRLDPGLGRIRADPSQLDHMLLNLAVNARDAMPEGGRLTVETRNAPADADADTGAFVALVVADTGIGMDDDVREHVFEPFFTTKPTGQGTGLGLATVHGIATQSGGSVRVESAPGAGTTFTILLPQVAASDEVEAASRRAPDDALAVGVREAILLVEDDGDVRALTRQMLEGCGYRVVTASDGPAALAICAQWGPVIDLVLTDVMMPGLSGLDLRRQLRAEHPHVKVLCMSGYSERLAQGAEGDDVEFIAKPFTAVALAGRVRSLLDGDAAGARVTDPAARA